MNEEIDVIELLKRVKEGKAPKLIEVDDYEYEFNSNYGSIEEIYPSIEENIYWSLDVIDFDTKIKILDKPIIEELEIKDEGGKYISPDTFEITAKVNEIIRYLRSKDAR